MSSKISALPNMTALVGTELLTGLQGVVNSNATPNQVKDFVQPYKVYRALLTQAGTDAPVAMVLENTLGGELVWSYADEGDYRGDLAGVFIESKTTINTAYGLIGGNQSQRISNNQIKVYSPALDGNLADTAIEILVYP